MDYRTSVAVRGSVATRSIYLESKVGLSIAERTDSGDVSRMSTCQTGQNVQLDGWE